MWEKLMIFLGARYLSKMRFLFVLDEDVVSLSKKQHAAHFLLEAFFEPYLLETDVIDENVLYFHQDVMKILFAKVTGKKVPEPVDSLKADMSLFLEKKKVYVRHEKLSDSLDAPLLEGEDLTSKIKQQHILEYRYVQGLHYILEGYFDRGFITLFGAFFCKDKKPVKVINLKGFIFIREVHYKLETFLDDTYPVSDVFMM